MADTAAVTAESRGTGRGNTYDPAWPGTFRTYNKYCPEIGVNLGRCSGGHACRCNPKTTNVEATYEDPRGGNRRNWGKWGGLCGPDNQYYATEADYYTHIATLN